MDAAARQIAAAMGLLHETHFLGSFVKGNGKPVSRSSQEGPGPQTQYMLGAVAQHTGVGQLTPALSPGDENDDNNAFAGNEAEGRKLLQWSGTRPPKTPRTPAGKLGKAKKKVRGAVDESTPELSGNELVWVSLYGSSTACELKAYIDSGKTSEGECVCARACVCTRVCHIFEYVKIWVNVSW